MSSRLPKLRSWMSPVWGVAAAFCLLCLSSCQSPPRDAVRAAEFWLARGDLWAAIAQLDRVPMADARYERARAFSLAVERRVRTGHRLVHEGMQLRAEWRDAEALRCFARALEVWPGFGPALAMREATERRMSEMGAEAGAPARRDGRGHEHSEPSFVVDDVAGDMLYTSPVETVKSSPEPLADQVERGVATTEVEGSGATSSVLVAATPLLESVAPSVGAPVAELLRDGKLDEAFVRVGAASPARGELAFRARIVRMLHQRALLRYGQGALERALEDWSRVQRLDPSHVQAADYAAAVRAELDRD